MPSGSSEQQRIVSLIEVIATLAATHFTYRFALTILDGDSPAGRVAAAGLGPLLAMVGVVAVWLRVRHRHGRISEAIGAQGGWPAAQLGVASLLMLLPLGAGLWLLGVPARARDADPVEGVMLLVLLTASVVSFLWSINRWPWLARPKRLLVVLVLVGVPIAPIAIDLLKGGAGASVSTMVLARFLGAGLCEEIFFRGYAQGRLNEAFGRPWRVLGVSFGPGLVIVCALFGLVHGFNTLAYLGEEWGPGWFAWGWAITVASPVFGLLRERSGSFIAPTALHGLTNMGSVFIQVLTVGT